MSGTPAELYATHRRLTQCKSRGLPWLRKGFAEVEDCFLAGDVGVFAEGLQVALEIVVAEVGGQGLGQGAALVFGDAFEGAGVDGGQFDEDEGAVGQ